MEPPDPEFVLRGCDGPVTSLAFLSNSWDRSCGCATYLVTGTQTGSLFVWNLKVRRVIHSMTSIHDNSVLSVTVLSGGGCSVLTQGRDGIVIRWELRAVDNWLKMGAISCFRYPFSLRVYNTKTNR